MLKIDIFCDVIDNFGDAGVCLHLAESLCRAGNDICVWCNNMPVISAIANERNAHNSRLQIKQWTENMHDYHVPDVVINAFNCRLNPEVMSVLRKKVDPLVRINLDYLSAETWVESCHGLISLSDDIPCYYFFPGFTDKTGGLNVDDGFKQMCQNTINSVVDQLTLGASPTTLSISMFSYENQAAKTILDSLECSTVPSHMTVFEGLPLANINKLSGLSLSPDDSASLGSLTLSGCRILKQEQYDLLLLKSHVNLVRGEDSVVRAMHTGHPFLWQIYVQKEDAHVKKLLSLLDLMRNVLLERCSRGESLPVALSAHRINEDMDYVVQCMLAYNNASDWPDNFSLESFFSRSSAVFADFAAYLCSRPSLAENLIRFIETKRAELRA